jgi:hypothetical protein
VEGGSGEQGELEEQSAARRWSRVGLGAECCAEVVEQDAQVGWHGASWRVSSASGEVGDADRWR